MDTLIEAPAWNSLKETDPTVRAVAEEHRLRRSPETSARIIGLLDGYIAQGVVAVQAIPGTREALETIAQRGVLGVYSTSPKQRTLDTLPKVGYRDLFDADIVIPQQDLDNIPKTEPAAFNLLERYLRSRQFVITAYTDDNESIIQAAVRSGASIPRIYHLNRTLESPEQQRKGYSCISSLILIE